LHPIVNCINSFKEQPTTYPYLEIDFLHSLQLSRLFEWLGIHKNSNKSIWMVFKLSSVRRFQWARNLTRFRSNFGVEIWSKRGRFTCYVFVNLISTSIYGRNFVANIRTFFSTKNRKIRPDFDIEIRSKFGQFMKPLRWFNVDTFSMVKINENFARLSFSFSD